MKKLLSLSVIILTLGLLNFVACKKEETTQNIETTSAKSIENCTSSLPKDGSGIWGLLNDENQRIHKLNEVNYHLAYATRQVLANAENKTQIFEAIKQSKKLEVDILKLCEENAEFKSVFEEALKESLKNHSSSDLVYKEEQNPLTFLHENMNVDIQYRPIIYTVKPYKNLSASFTVAIPVGNQCGDVPAWDNEKEKLLSEESLMKDENVVFFVGHGDGTSTGLIFNLDKSKNIVTNSNTEASARMNLDMKVPSVQINNGFKFGNENYAQVQCIYIRWRPTAGIRDLDEGRIVDVHQSVIQNSSPLPFVNKNFNTHTTAAEWDVSGDLMHIVFFEYDWYGSAKSFIPSCATTVAINNGIALAGRRNFNSDIYGPACGTTLSLLGPPSGYTTTQLDFINPSSIIRIVRYYM